jgi:hypothetical protein
MEKGMNMQDKEFDDLFRAKLDNFETEPSAQVWQNIDAELNGKKSGRGIGFILSIAASVIVLITAGILFIPQKGVVKHDHPDSNQVVVNNLKPTVVKPENTSVAATVAKKAEQAAVAQTPAKFANSSHQTKIIGSPVTPEVQNTLAVAKGEPVEQAEQPALASATVSKQEPIVLDPVNVNPAIKQSVDNSAISLPVQPVLASTDVPAKATKQVVKKHGIHNFGDLVNLVVAKVDKRKDKVIEFTDNDDDESTITGVHLGAIRIKKDN